MVHPTDYVIASVAWQSHGYGIRHSGEGRNPVVWKPWTPACAGVTITN